MEYEFDIPTIGLDLVRYSVQGLVEATNGDRYTAQTAVDAAQFNLTSGAELVYLTNSLQPSIGIPLQNMQFRAAVGNNGLANVQLIADSSTLTIRNLTDSVSTNLDANYGIPGEDTVAIAFETVQLPANFDPGIYDLAMRLRGTLENGDPYDTTLTAVNQFTALSQAELVLDTFSIQPAAVRPGDEGIPAFLQFTNIGQSVARLSNIALQFRDSLDINVNSQWVITGSNITLPVLVDSGETITVFDTLSVSGSATLGPIRAGTNWRYADTLRASVNIDSSRLNLDTVNVIIPGQIYIETTTIPLADLPNRPNANTNQPYRVQTLYS